MRKTYCKTGLLVVMACLSLLTAGFISSGNVMASHRHHHTHRFVHRPHIIFKMLPNTAQYDHQYVARAVIYGVGFDNCGNCGSDQSNYSPCDSGCNAPAPADTPAPCDSGCSTPTPTDTPSPCEAGCSTSHQEVTDKVTTTDVQTTITTTTTMNVSHHSIGCHANCTPLPPNTVPCSPCSSNNAPNYNNNTPNYNNAPNSNTPNYNNNAPNATCPSYNACGTGSNNSGTGPNNSGAGPNDSNTGSGNSGCDCNSDNTANLQGNVPFTAPGINLSRIPVNTFGEFRVGVNIRMTPKQAGTRPSFWATNSYNGQRSDSAPLPCCPSAFCCQ